MKTFDELWKDLEENFDWEKVHRTMTFLDWKWQGKEVSISDLKQFSMDLCQECFVKVISSKSKLSCRSGSGGLYAEYEIFHNQPDPHEELSLEFYIESFSVW